MQQPKVSPEEIMQYCTNNFKIIMPVQKSEFNELNDNLAGISRISMDEDAAKTSLIFSQSEAAKNIDAQQKRIQYNMMNCQLFQPSSNSGIGQASQLQNQQTNYGNNNKLLKTFITPFEKHHLQELVEQSEIMIQLLLQNVLLANSESTQLRTYNLLSKLIERRDQVLTRIGQDHKLIQYTIPFSLFNDINKSKELTVDFIPQMSIFQSPLLNILPQIKPFLKQKNHFTKEQIVEQIGSEFSPIINKLYLPTFSSNFGKNSSRSKFTPLDDNLLLQGLTKYGTSQYYFHQFCSIICLIKLIFNNYFI